jgi:hypothetical protein
VVQHVGEQHHVRARRIGGDVVGEHRFGIEGSQRPVAREQ